MIGSLALQKAVYTALTGIAGVGLYDEVPTTAALPYVVIGQTSLERPWDTHDSEGSEEFVQIDVWSRYKGATQVKQVMAEVDNRLHDASMALEAGSLVLLQRDFAQVLKETVGAETWRHGVMRYRALISA